MGAISAHASGATVDLLVSPRASKSRVVGLHDGRVKVQIAAPPVDGEANEEVIAFFSRALGVPRAQVELQSGSTGKRKRLLVHGTTPLEVATRLELAYP